MSSYIVVKDIPQSEIKNQLVLILNFLYDIHFERQSEEIMEFDELLILVKEDADGYCLYTKIHPLIHTMLLLHEQTAEIADMHEIMMRGAKSKILELGEHASFPFYTSMVKDIAQLIIARE
jgi:hypothetical protein